MVVMVSNGAQMVTYSKCDSLIFSIQGTEFCNDLRLLPIQGYDIILGLDWLSQWGDMRINWKDKWVKFQKDDQAVKLQVSEEVAVVRMCEEINMVREL
jgi:Retroviral aspartyl protease